ncbi:MAG: hypothetical protein R2873_19275 [Caldilineaceae bacterium]
MMLSAPVWGVVADRFGRKPTIAALPWRRGDHRPDGLRAECRNVLVVLRDPGW